MAPTITVVSTQPEEVKTWQSYSRVGLRIGAVDAPVTITEFSDFQCPFCKELNVALREIRKRYPTQVAIVFRHYPLERIHPYAWAGALAGECAAAQSRFEAFDDSVYSHQDLLGQRPWVQFAAEAGVADTGAFQRCLRDSSYVDHVRRDVQAGKALNVLGTPTVLVNRWRIRGPNSRDAIDSLVQKELKGRVVATTVLPGR